MRQLAAIAERCLCPGRILLCERNELIEKAVQLLNRLWGQFDDFSASVFGISIALQKAILDHSMNDPLGIALRLAGGSSQRGQ